MSDIKRLRELLKMSQELFASKLGVSPRTVQNWEAGKVVSQTKLRILRKWASMFPDEEFVFKEEGDFNRKPVRVRQDHNDNSAVYGYVNIAVPEKDQSAHLNPDGIIIGDTSMAQFEHYKSIIAAKDEQIARLMAMIEEKDKTIARLIEKL